VKRGLSAVLAVLLLSTAVLHIFAHSDLAESSCEVCHVQQSRVPAAAAPRIVVAEAAGVLLAAEAVPRAIEARASAAAARAPPAFLA